MNYRLIHRFLLLALMGATAHAKVTIFSHYFGQPEFIKYQHLFFEKNMLDDYEFVVVEDSKDKKVSKKIRNECQKYGIQYIHVPRSAFESPKLPIVDAYVGLGSPSFECSVCVQYIYDNYVIPSKDICMIIDNDIFLLSPLSVEKYLESTPFAYVHQLKGGVVEYMLPNFLIFNPPYMPEKERLNFNLGAIMGVNTDSGGYTHFYLQDHKDKGKIIPIHYLYNTPSPLKERFRADYPRLFNSENWSSHYFIGPEAFLHIRMGSNWSNNSQYSKMIKEVRHFFDHLLMQ